MKRLLTPEDLSEYTGMNKRRVVDLCRTQNWPHIRFSRNIIRFTEEHIDQILKMLEVTPEVDNNDQRFALTQGSKGRNR